MSEPTGATWIAGLIRTGALIPVAVFGGCDHPLEYDDGSEHPCGDPDHWGYGLSDRFSEHSPGGSDCNRAVPYLLRPSDEAMADPEVRAAIWAVLDDFARKDPVLRPLTGEPSERQKALDAMKAKFDETLARFGFPELEWTWGSGAQRRRDAPREPQL